MLFRFLKKQQWLEEYQKSDYLVKRQKPNQVIKNIKYTINKHYHINENKANG